MAVITYEVSPALSDELVNTLFARAWPDHQPRPFGPVLRRSLAYIGAFAEGTLVGFVNVAWDGGEHAFLLDPTVDPPYQRGGVGTELVRQAISVAHAGGAKWLHVDYEAHLDRFYQRCGFRSTAAGLIRLR